MGKRGKVTQANVGADGSVEMWPRPVYDGVWTDGDGATWRMRGERLGAKRFRRLVGHEELLVAHAYDMSVTVVVGHERADVMGRRLLMVQESC